MALPDGRLVSVPDLYVEALRHDSSIPYIWNDLGCWLTENHPEAGTVQVPDGRSLTAQELFLEAVDRWPEYPDGLGNLGSTLGAPSDTVTLRDGRVLSKTQLEQLAAGGQ